MSGPWHLCPCLEHHRPWTEGLIQRLAFLAQRGRIVCGVHGWSTADSVEVEHRIFLTGGERKDSRGHSMVVDSVGALNGQYR